MIKEKLSVERNELYKEQFDKLSIGATEFAQIRRFFKSRIFPKLPAQNHFLDVGCGRGNYARPFSAQFEQTTVVEVNEIYFNEVTGWLQEQGRTFKGHNADWLDVDLGDVQIDLVLMSHVLYYVEKNKRLQFIHKAYDLLKSGGYLVIILNSEACGIRKVYKEFYNLEYYESMPYGEEIAEMLREAGFCPTIKEKVLPSTITLDSHEDMGMLIDFLLLRQIPFQTESQIAHRSTFIEKNLADGQQYVMDSENTLVILRKP